MAISLIFLICFNAVVYPQQFNLQRASRARSAVQSSLTGVYRIDIPASDKLYSVVAGASSNVPFGEQQRFFIDLAVRLTPPDLLAIEQQGTRISFGSSRAPRMTFVADGAARNTRAPSSTFARRSRKSYSRTTDAQPSCATARGIGYRMDGKADAAKSFRN